MHRQRIAVLVTGGVGMLSTFLPWSHVSWGGTTLGTAWEVGWITFGLFAVSPVLSLLGPKAQPIRAFQYLIAVTSVLASCVGVWKIIDFNLVTRNLAILDPSIGIGLYLVVICGVLGAVLVLVLKGTTSKSVSVKELAMTVEERLGKMEQELAIVKRRNRLLLVVVGLIVVGSTVMGLGLAIERTNATAITQSPVQKEIRANAFLLLDADGNPRAILGVDKDGPMLSMKDEKGKLRAILGMDKGRSGLFLNDEKGNPRAALAVHKDGSLLGLNDEKGTPRASLGVDKDGSMLGINDEKGNPRAALAVFKDGPLLGLNDEKGTRRASLTVIEDEPKLSLNDQRGKRRAILGVDKDGPELFLNDENGKPRAALAVFENGPGLGLSDDKGTIRALLNVFKDRIGLGLFDENSKRLAEMAVLKEGPKLSVRDENDKVLWSAP